MTITANLVKELRERTGSGMMECKKALLETNGDIDAAIELLRKRGQAKADKKSSRVTAEGIVMIAFSSDQKTAVLLEVNCETDFVALDENFVNFVKHATDAALAHKISDVASLAALPHQKGSAETVEEARQQLISKVGENITIRRLYLMTSEDAIGSYIHNRRIGVLVSVIGGDADLRKDLAMHIAANSPMVLTPSEVSDESVAKEREIYLAQAQTLEKPAEIIEKMVAGRIKKYCDEVSLLGQAFVKRPEVSVGQLLQEKGAKVTAFVRYAVGEGIEKQSCDFASEVMAQVRGS
jgi:elongation factor Ts